MGKKTVCLYINRVRKICRYVHVSTHHQIRGSSESLYIHHIVAIIHLTEYSCHARHDSGLHICECGRKEGKASLLSGEIDTVCQCLRLL